MNSLHAVLSSTGLRSWNVDLTVCDLNKELQLFETRHTAQFSSQVKGQCGFTELADFVCGTYCILQDVCLICVHKRLPLSVAWRQSAALSCDGIRA